MKRASIKYTGRISMPCFVFFFLLLHTAFGQKKYTIHYLFDGKDTLNTSVPVSLQTDFASRSLAEKYIASVPSLLLSRGFPAASVDSVFYDTAFAKVAVYTGAQYQWAQINTDSVESVALESTGWVEQQFKNKPVDFARLQLQQEKIIDYYENSGYPFAEVSLKDVAIKGNTIEASIHVKKGVLYHIDSIRVYGKVKIKNLFLQHYLGIFNGSIYNRKKLEQINKRIRELPFVTEIQSWDLSMLGTGATLNLYLEPKRSSEVNILVGFAPANTITGKTQLTADVHLDLKNALGNGEGILLNWQQLQPQSPRLNLGYTQPYIFNSNLGVDFSFDLLKRDSSYLQLNGMLGLQYLLSSSQSFRIFYQAQQDNLLSGGVDTNQVLFSKRLPENIDVKSGNVGIGYHFVNTNYRLNPRKGYEMDITASAGIKKTFKNNDIVNLKDPSNPGFDFNSLYDSIRLKTYRLKLNITGAGYLPLGKSSTLKLAVNGGLLQSPQNFQNELFRIGGYKILRGFDEESIYADKFAVFTAEYRYLVGINSYFFGFSDVGFTKTNYNTVNYSNSFISGGAGLAFETKFGLLNLSYAIGKRNDLKFDIRNASKIHFGYINYF